MKLIPAATGFAIGVIVTSVIGLWAVQPMLRESWRVNLDSDVHGPLAGALEWVEQSASNSDCTKTAFQLRVLNKRFDSYRKGGPTPAEWLNDVLTATPPTEPQRAPAPSIGTP